MPDVTIRLKFDHPAWSPDPGLGNISWGSYGDMKVYRDRSDREELWRRYDEKFGTREDYRLWRVLARGQYPSELMKTWPTPFSVGTDGLNSFDRKVVFGVLSVLGMAFKKWADEKDGEASAVEETELWDVDIGLRNAFTDEEIAQLATLCRNSIEADSPVAVIFLTQVPRNSGLAVRRN